jgi:drug/metabolite transporter (DMT)-like permease
MNLKAGSANCTSNRPSLRLKLVPAVILLAIFFGLQWFMQRNYPPSPKILKQAPFRWIFPFNPWFAILYALMLALGCLWLLRTRARSDLGNARFVVILMVLGGVGGLLFYFLSTLHLQVFQGVAY